MKKLMLLGIVCTLCIGCGRGWMPLRKGAPCGSDRCAAPAPLPSAGCNDCGTTSGYAPYSSEVYEGAVIDGGVIDGYYPSDTVVPGTITTPPAMGNIQPPTT